MQVMRGRARLKISGVSNRDGRSGGVTPELTRLLNVPLPQILC